jgi:Kef-type K+ transport system membrane component KefB
VLTDSIPAAAVAAAAHLAWPLVVALAWIGGEIGRRWRVPRISVYALVGFACGATQLGLLPATGGGGSSVMLVNIAFGLILFEFGYRVNLRWFVTNPWLAATGLLEALLTFAAVYLIARWGGASTLSALLLASLAMPTSPASVMLVINEQRCSGQVTERIVHLAAMNCVLTVFAFNAIVGFWTFETSGRLGLAISSSAVVLVVSAGLGALFGLGVPALLRRLGHASHDSTVAFTIAIVLLVGIALALRYSPLLATLTFGIVARHRRITLNQAQRNFGALGDLLAVLLFTYVAATIEWPRVAAGLWLGLALIGARLAAKVLGVAALSRASGISWRKGALTGLGMMPISVFVILLLEHTRFLGIDLVDHLAPLAAATLLLEIAAPLATQLALRLAGETHEPRSS